MKTRIFLSLLIFLISFNLRSQVAKYTVVETYQIPGKASGLAFDGTYLYSGIYGVGGDEVYQIDTSDGSSVLLCSGPMDDAYGMTFDGQYLWTTFHNAGSLPAWAIQFDASGMQLDTFVLMTTYISGIEYDNGLFWVAAYYSPDGAIYKVDTAGNIYSQFPSPFNQPWDLCLEHEFLWIADYYNNTIDKVDTTGNLVESHPSLGDRPAGITFDGKYLWYAAGPLNDSSTLYKVEIDVIQEPKIQIPVVNHDFGDVLAGGTGTWNATFKNIGTADLVIDSITFKMTSSPMSCATALPVTVLPGDSTAIDFMFIPIIGGIVHDTAIVYSNSAIAAPELTLRGNGTTVGINEKEAIKGFSVYPNPLVDQTEIYFVLEENENVSVSIYNLLGERIREIKNENLTKGEHRILWDARDENNILQSPGMYFCRITGESFEVSECLILTK